MRTSSVMTLFVLFLCLTSCTPQFPGMSRDQKQIKIIWDECVAALQSKDMETFSTYWYQDSTYTAVQDKKHAGPVLNLEQLKLWQPMLKGTTALRLTTKQIDIQTSREKQSADLTATLYVLVKLPDQEISGNLFIRAYLIKTGEQWLFVHINQSRFPA